MFQNANVTSKSGDVTLSITDSNHIYIESHNWTVRGAGPYRASAHANRMDGVNWDIQNLNIRTPNDWKWDASPSLKSATTSEFQTVVSAFAANATNARLFSKAEFDSLQRALDRLRETEAKQKKELTETQRAIEKLNRTIER